jgi:DNA-binding CsgD family transcriptional regulator
MKEKILELRKLGYSYKKIEKELNCARSTISYHCQKNNLNTPLESPNKLSKIIINKINNNSIDKTDVEISTNLKLSINTIRKYRNKKRLNKKHEIICIQCGKTMNGYGNKFCSNNCSSTHKHNASYKHFIENNDDAMYHTGYYTPKGFKDFFLKEQNNKCAICGSEPIWMNKILVFVLDHIDGDCSNNKRKNLRLICPNCDSQTDTFKSKTKHSKRRDYIKENIIKNISKNGE